MPPSGASSRSASQRRADGDTTAIASTCLHALLQGRIGITALRETTSVVSGLVKASDPKCTTSATTSPVKLCTKPSGQWHLIDGPAMIEAAFTMPYRAASKTRPGASHTQSRERTRATQPADRCAQFRTPYQNGRRHKGRRTAQVFDKRFKLAVDGSRPRVQRRGEELRRSRANLEPILHDPNLCQGSRTVHEQPLFRTKESVR